jgi:hypothetical protein
MVERETRRSDGLPVRVALATYERLSTMAGQLGLDDPGLVIDRLLTAPASGTNEAHFPLRVYAIYDGHRFDARYDPLTRCVKITSGVLDGHVFTSPTAAAMAAIHDRKPEVRQGRNGWAFWKIAASDQPLITIRHEAT